MRASRWYSALCIMCGVSLFAMVMALWPTRAYADILDINLQWDELRLYEDATTLPSEVDLSYIRTLNNYVNIDGNGLISGYFEYLFESDFFDAYDSSLNNPVLALYIPLGSSIIPKDYKIRVTFPSTAWRIQTDTPGVSSAWEQMSASVSSVWVGSSISALQQCTYSSGGYVAPTSGRVVMVVLNTSSRTGTKLLERHRYMMEGMVKLYVEIPDPTATQINDQSVINTQNIISGQQQQTQELKDTTGSNSIVGPATTQGQNVFENLSLVTTMEGAFDNISQAISTQDSDTGIPFPGMSMAGFVIPAYNVDPTQMMPEIMPYVKGMLTFVFCCAFLSHIVHLIQAIFGIYDYGEMVLDDHVPDVGYTVSKKFRPDYDIDEDLGF